MRPKPESKTKPPRAAALTGRRDPGKVRPCQYGSRRAQPQAAVRRAGRQRPGAPALQKLTHRVRFVRIRAHPVYRLLTVKPTARRRGGFIR